MNRRGFIKTEIIKTGICAAVALCAARIGFAAVAGWAFRSAPLAAHPSEGRERPDGAHELRVPDRGGCGWWTAAAPVAPGGGVRVRATAEIALDDAQGFVYNDCAMVVQWNRPKAGPDARKGGGFYQRDFVAYSDRVEGGRVVRTFDETFAVPGRCEDVAVEFIGKWHAMTVAFRDVTVENVPAPKPRLVRCVVGNPHEATGNRIIAERRRKGEVMDAPKTMAVHLAQIEKCLTNIFAHVERPDIILFAECLASQGARPEDVGAVAEAIPGGPSWRLAQKYATKYRCNIAMNVKERDESGQCHNTVFVCDRRGRLAGRYRKMHLTVGEYQDGLVPGDGFPVFDLDFGRVGALVCWDNWFSESIKLAKRNGAEMLLFPLAGCAKDHIDTCFPSRAIDAGIPMLVAIRQGHLPNGIIDRDGTWRAQTFEDGGYAVADLDLNERKRTFWLSVGPGDGDPYELYYDESRPEVYEKFDWRQPRK